MRCYQKDYPRPQFVRKQWESLNGSWEFAFDDNNIGEAEGWHKTFHKEMNIIVPYTYESMLSGIHDERLHEYIWYHKKINVDASLLATNNYILHFEGSDYFTKLWVNGQYAGDHTGGYTRFSFDITPFVHDGVNEITVKVEDHQDITYMRGKQRWRDENYVCFYTQTTGIWKTVWSEYVPKTSVSYVKMTPHLRNMNLEVVANISGVKLYQGEPLYLEANVSFQGTLVTSIRSLVKHRDVRLVVDLRADLSNIEEFYVKLWTPEQPNLYDIEFRLVQNNTILDQVGSYFAMREITIEGSHILLNGVPLYQRLVLDQGYWKDSLLTPPDEEALKFDIDITKDMGYNGVRKHQKIEDERYMYWCDVKGLLVWCEAPSYFYFTEEAAAEFVNQWSAILKQNYNHPCIITWTPFNESWGLTNVKEVSREQHFTEAIYYLTKTIDPYRPVITNDGWEHTLSDIITLHDYCQDGQNLKDRFIQYKDEILSSCNSPYSSRGAFGKGFSYKGQPIIISEYGGISIRSDIPGWGYGNMVDKEDFLQRFSDITMAIKEIPYVSGYCYTQLTDVQQEINGMADMTRKPKVDYEDIRKINML